MPLSSVCRWNVLWNSVSKVGVGADLKRWGLLDSQAGIDELKARDKDFDNFIVGKHRRLPIPRDEVENSTVGGVAHLTQNPNY